MFRLWEENPSLRNRRHIRCFDGDQPRFDHPAEINAHQLLQQHHRPPWARSAVARLFERDGLRFKLGWNDFKFERIIRREFIELERNVRRKFLG